MPILTLIFMFIFGIMIGSFLNVLIIRLPLEKELVFKRSNCLNCQKLIVWYENIPILSFLFLKGKCSGCHHKISLQYPIVELLTGLVSILLAPKWISTLSILNYCFLFSIFCVFLCHFIIDFKHKILPNSLNIYLGLLFFAHSIIYKSWQFWLIGSAIGLLFPLLVAWAFYKYRGIEGLGGGDIKLFFVLGLYLGPLGIIQNIFLSCLIGSLVGLSLIISKRIDRNFALPFGPSIIIVASFQIFFPTYYLKVSNLLIGL